jgi:hypothetical protein
MWMMGCGAATASSALVALPPANLDVELAMTNTTNAPLSFDIEASCGEAEW